MLDPEVKNALSAVEKQLGDLEISYKTKDTEIDALRKNSESMQRLLTQMQGKLDDSAKGLITKDELKTFTDKIAADVLSLQKAI